MSMMAQGHVICKACTMTGLVWLPSFLCSGVKLLPGKLDGPSLLLYGDLPISPFSRNGWSGCLHALVRVWGTAPISRLFTPLSILIARTLKSCSFFVRVGVLPLTPFTPYLGSSRSLYGTSTGLVVFWSMARFMMRLSLALRSLVTKISRARG